MDGQSQAQPEGMQPQEQAQPGADQSAQGIRYGFCRCGQYLHRGQQGVAGAGLGMAFRGGRGAGRGPAMTREELVLPRGVCGMGRRCRMGGRGAGTVENPVDHGQGLGFGGRGMGRGNGGRGGRGRGGR